MIYRKKEELCYRGTSIILPRNRLRLRLQHKGHFLLNIRRIGLSATLYFFHYPLFEPNPIYPEGPKPMQIYMIIAMGGNFADTMLLSFRNGGQSLFYLLSSCFLCFCVSRGVQWLLVDRSRSVEARRGVKSWMSGVE